MPGWRCVSLRKRGGRGGLRVHHPSARTQAILGQSASCQSTWRRCVQAGNSPGGLRVRRPLPPRRGLEEQAAQYPHARACPHPPTHADQTPAARTRWWRALAPHKTSSGQHRWYSLPLVLCLAGGAPCRAEPSCACKVRSAVKPPAMASVAGNGLCATDSPSQAISGPCEEDGHGDMRSGELTPRWSAQVVLPPPAL